MGEEFPIDLRMLKSFRCLRPLKMVSKVPSKLPAISRDRDFAHPASCRINTRFLPPEKNGNLDVMSWIRDKEYPINTTGQVATENVETLWVEREAIFWDEWKMLKHSKAHEISRLSFASLSSDVSDIDGCWHRLPPARLAKQSLESEIKILPSFSRLKSGIN